MQAWVGRGIGFVAGYFSVSSRKDSGGDLPLKNWIQANFGRDASVRKQEKCYRELIHSAMMAEVVSNSSMFSKTMFPETLLLDVKRLENILNGVFFYGKACSVIARMRVQHKEKHEMLGSLATFFQNEKNFDLTSEELYSKLEVIGICDPNIRNWLSDVDGVVHVYIKKIGMYLFEFLRDAAGLNSELNAAVNAVAQAMVNVMANAVTNVVANATGSSSVSGSSNTANGIGTGSGGGTMGNNTLANGNVGAALTNAVDSAVVNAVINAIPLLGGEKVMQGNTASSRGSGSGKSRSSAGSGNVSGPSTTDNGIGAGSAHLTTASGGAAAGAGAGVAAVAGSSNGVAAVAGAGSGALGSGVSATDSGSGGGGGSLRVGSLTNGDMGQGTSNATSAAGGAVPVVIYVDGDEMDAENRSSEADTLIKKISFHDRMKNEVGAVMLQLMPQLDELGKQLFIVSEMTRLIHGERYLKLALEYCDEVIKREEEEEEKKKNMKNSELHDGNDVIVIMDVD